MKLGPGKGRIVFDGCLSFSFGIKFVIFGAILCPLCCFVASSPRKVQDNTALKLAIL